MNREREVAESIVRLTNLYVEVCVNEIEKAKLPPTHKQLMYHAVNAGLSVFLELMLLSASGSQRERLLGEILQ